MSLSKKDLEDKIQLMKEEVVELKKELASQKEANVLSRVFKSDEIEKKLTCRAYGVISRGKRFELVELHFNPDTGDSKITDKKYLADTPYRALFEFNKQIVAYNKILSKAGENENE